MSRVAKERASRLREFKDLHDEFKATGNEKARQRRHEVMFSGSPEDVKRAGEVLAGEASDEGSSRKDRLRKSSFSGWRKK